MLKFRTMVPGAVELGREQGLTQDPFGIVKNDPRVTRVGRWLRRTGFDELPQLVHVVSGKMSLVGPRADLVEQAAAYGDRERRRLTVRPGITGWAQIHGRDSVSWTERFELDLWYLDNWSLWLDAKILVRTVGEVFRAEPEPIEDTLNIERAEEARLESVSELVEVDPADWDELLERLGCADVYLLRGYVESACLLEPARPVYLHLEARGGDVVFPALVRELDSDRHDVTTPYGYGGPVAAGSEPPARQFWELYQEWCESNGIVTSFFRFHPLFANQRYAGPDVRVEQLVGTVGWRLGRPDLFAGMHGTHRTACRKAERAGVSVSAVRAPEGLSAFASLYELTMQRVGADALYLFSPAYWEALAAGLGERIVVFDAQVGGEVVASALCFATAPWLHYHLGATGERGRSLGASNLLLYSAALWASERGYERFHLGGGAGGRDDSLLSFKRRFDESGLLDCAVGKAVHDPAAYRALTGRADGDLGGYFPAYREAR